MAFKHLRSRHDGEYLGIRVGTGVVSLSKGINAMLTALGWKFVRIEFDAEAHQIRLLEGQQYVDHKITKHKSISSALSKVMPSGRYLLTSEADLIFTKLDPV